MQPNQQDPESQPIQPTEPAPVRLDPYGRPLPPEPVSQGIPDYLHLDPIKEQKPKISKKPIVFCVLVVLVIISIALWFIFDLSPEQRFYRALENSMNTSFIERKLEMLSNESGRKLVGTVESNLSNLESPLTKLNYEYSQKSDSPKVDFSWRATTIYTSDSESYAKLNGVSANSTTSIARTGQWYILSGSGAGYFDFLGLGAIYGSPVVFFPVGNFSDQERHQILEEIKIKKLYKIQSFREVVSNGLDAIIYKISIDNKKLNDLTRAITVRHGLVNRASVQIDDTTVFTLTIDKAQNKMTEISYEAKNAFDSKITTIRQAIAYPDVITIDRPDSPIKWRQDS